MTDVLGKVRSGEADAGVVYRTTDGGKNWKPLLSGAAANINFIYFIDWNHGWMLGESGGKMSDETEGENILLVTTNGGRSWTRKTLPNVTGLYFTDDKNGWAVGRNATLLKTTDGGLEWKKVESIEKLIGALQSVGPANRLEFEDGQEILARGQVAKHGRFLSEIRNAGAGAFVHRPT